MAAGVAPPWLAQYPFAAICSIISGQVIGWPASSSTHTAASRALVFLAFGSSAFLPFVFGGAAPVGPRASSLELESAGRLARHA